MRLLEKLQSRLELYRLEQRYTRQRKRRSTFISGSRYVDGEYVASATSLPSMGQGRKISGGSGSGWSSGTSPRDGNMNSNGNANANGDGRGWKFGSRVR